MAFKDLVIVFVFALSATLIPRARTDVVTSPNGDRFMLPAGRPFSITCDLTARYSEIREMTWKTMEELIDGQNGKIQKINDSTVKLVFTNPTSADSGNYFCSCSYIDYNMLFENHITREKDIYIVFYGPELTFQSSFENVIAEESTDLVVKCSAIGEEPITYEWRNQYQEVISDNSSSRIYAENLGSESFLKIRSFSSSEAGSYTCTASNKDSQARKEYEIFVCSSAGEKKCNNASYVRHVQVIKITSNSIQFAISASGPASSIIVRYTIKNLNKIDVYEKEWKRGDTYEVRNLTPGKLYSFIFKAIPLNNDVTQVTDVWSKEQEIFTLPDMPDVALHALSEGTIKIERIEQKYISSNIDEYKLTYFPLTQKDGYWTSSSCPITINIPSCSNVNYTVSGLSSKTFYELQLQAHTASGYGEPYKQKIYVQ